MTKDVYRCSAASGSQKQTNNQKKKCIRQGSLFYSCLTKKWKVKKNLLLGINNTSFV